MPAPQNSLYFDDSFFANTPVKRLIAWVIDTALIFLLVLLILPFTFFTGVFFLPLLMLTLGLVYRWVWIAQISATPGMWLLGIEFRTLDGARFDASTAFWHSLGFTVSVSVFPLQLISVALMLTSEQKTGLSDLVLRTVAINRPVKQSVAR